MKILTKPMRKLSVIILLAITISTALVSSLKLETAMAQLANFNLDAIKNLPGLDLFKGEKGNKGEKGDTEATGPAGPPGPIEVIGF